MLHELTEDAYQTVVPLFEAGPSAYAQVIMRAVAAGNAPGRVWVDDRHAPPICPGLGSPATAMIWRGRRIIRRSTRQRSADP